MTSSPIATTSSGRRTDSSERSPSRTSPSLPGSISTKAPKDVRRVTLPVYVSPSSTSLVRFSIMALAFWACSSSGEPIKTVPSSSTSILQPVSSMMERMTRPPGPITAPILSCGIDMRNMRGANGESSGLTSGMVSRILLSMNRRASWAWERAASMISMVIPLTLMSIWRAVMPFSVPATLKSMSPMASSRPAMSVRIR